MENNILEKYISDEIPPINAIPKNLISELNRLNDEMCRVYSYINKHEELKKYFEERLFYLSKEESFTDIELEFFKRHYSDTPESFEKVITNEEIMIKEYKKDLDRLELELSKWLDDYEEFVIKYSKSGDDPTDELNTHEQAYRVCKEELEELSSNLESCKKALVLLQDEYKKAQKESLELAKQGKRFRIDTIRQKHSEEIMKSLDLLVELRNLELEAVEDNHHYTSSMRKRYYQHAVASAIYSLKFFLSGKTDITKLATEINQMKYLEGC